MFRRWKGNDFSMRRLKCLNLQARQEMSSTVDLVDIGGIGYGRRRQWTPDSPFAAVCTYASRIATEKNKETPVAKMQRECFESNFRLSLAANLLIDWPTFEYISYCHILILYLYVYLIRYINLTEARVWPWTRLSRSSKNAQGVSSRSRCDCANVTLCRRLLKPCFSIQAFAREWNRIPILWNRGIMWHPLCLEDLRPLFKI